MQSHLWWGAPLESAPVSLGSFWLLCRSTAGAARPLLPPCFLPCSVRQRVARSSGWSCLSLPLLRRCVRLPLCSALLCSPVPSSHSPALSHSAADCPAPPVYSAHSSLLFANRKCALTVVGCCWEGGVHTKSGRRWIGTPSCLGRPPGPPAIGWAGVKRGGSLKNTFWVKRLPKTVFFLWKGEGYRGQWSPQDPHVLFHEWLVYIRSFSGRKKKRFISCTLKARCVRFNSKYWQVCWL